MWYRLIFQVNRGPKDVGGGGPISAGRWILLKYTSFIRNLLKNGSTKFLKKCTIWDFKVSLEFLNSFEIRPVSYGFEKFYIIKIKNPEFFFKIDLFLGKSFL